MNKGWKWTKEQREKFSNQKKGKKAFAVVWNKGKTGYKMPPASEDRKRKISQANKGRKFTKEHLRNLSLSHIGIQAREKHPNWKGGVTSVNEQIRKSLEYKLWREAVFKRDNWTCIWCGKRGGVELNADHIMPFSKFPELRFAIDNGRTLCVPCHKTTESYMNRWM